MIWSGIDVVISEGRWKIKCSIDKREMKVLLGGGLLASGQSTGNDVC